MEPSRKVPVNVAPVTSFLIQEAPLPLPAPLSSFIGREAEIEMVTNLALNPTIRLITLTGPGGVGKTRLALHVAATLENEFTDGVVFVDLSSILQPELLASAMVKALGIRSTDNASALTRLKAALRSRKLVVALDNFEQLVSSAPLLSEILQACPDLTFLVTSRASLNITGERVVRVPPLSVPALSSSDSASLSGNTPQTTDLSELLQFPAVRLFVERSQTVQQSFALTHQNAFAVTEICARLDGLPLAIELAAARTGIFAPEELATRLEPRLQMLTDGPQDLPDRQRTMLSAIAWSYDLLDPTEQAIFRRLAIFSGGCTFEAAEAVCWPVDENGVQTGQGFTTHIESLASKSLINIVMAVNTDLTSTPSRIVLLETVREFALGELAAAGDDHVARQLHATYYQQLTQQGESSFWGDVAGDWYSSISSEAGNLRAGLAWAIDNQETDVALVLSCGLIEPYVVEDMRRLSRDDAQILLGRIHEVLALPGGSPGHRANAMIHGYSLTSLTDLEESEYSFGEEAFRMAQEAENPLLVAMASYNLGRTAFRLGDLGKALNWITQALEGFLELGARGRAAWAQSFLASLNTQVAFQQNRNPAKLQRAEELCEASLSTFQELNYSPGIDRARHVQAQVAYARGELGKSLSITRELLSRAWEAQVTVQSFLEDIADIAGAIDQADFAAFLYGASSEQRQRMNYDMPEVYRDQAEKDMNLARQALGDVVFDNYAAQGRKTPLDQVVAKALAFADEYHRARGPALTPREADILPLLAEGKTAREIGNKLFLSHRTVETHIANIYIKLQARNRDEAILAARDAGILEIDSDR